MTEALNARSASAGGDPRPPLYQKVETDLRRRIDDGEFAPGEALPTEGALCAAYDVSRITVRRALDSLALLGLIQRRRGAGSFVSEPRRDGVRSVRLTGSLDEFLATAGALNLDVRALEEAPAEVDVAQDLGVLAGETVVWMDLVSSLAEGPVLHLDIYFPAAVGRLIALEDVAAGVPIARLVERKTGARIVSARQVILPALADARAAEALNIAVGTPVLKLRRLYLGETGAPLELAVLTLHPDRYAYEIEFRAGHTPP